DLINGINPGFLELAASRGATRAAGGKTTLHSGTVTVPVLSERQAGMFFEMQEDRAGDVTVPPGAAGVAVAEQPGQVAVDFVAVARDVRRLVR
ncbi:hypothetical protein, partial [Spongiactinospora sp. TRM90649]|uniref:hypothetical protein n=1 Tax=Spongiactinospora sp. TRM90649 TaxID=3031114 RepID=UPI0023F859D5